MVSFHILLLDRAGNNLVNADFSLYLGHIFTVKHIYLTLYIVYMCCNTPTYGVPLYLLALLAVPAARCACLPAPVRARACVCAWACGRARCARCPCCSLCSLWPSYLRPIACARPRVRPCPCVRPCACARGRCPPTFQSLAVHFIRLYCSFSRRASARCACRKLF